MEIVKAYEPRPVQVNGVTYLVQELITLEDGQEKRTTKSLGRETDFLTLPRLESVGFLGRVPQATLAGVIGTTQSPSEVGGHTILYRARD